MRARGKLCTAQTGTVRQSRGYLVTYAIPIAVSLITVGLSIAVPAQQTGRAAALVAERSPADLIPRIG